MQSHSFFSKGGGDINSPIFLFNFETIQCQNQGWSGGAMVLGKLHQPMPESFCFDMNSVKIHSAVIEMLSVSWFMLF